MQSLLVYFQFHQARERCFERFSKEFGYLEQESLLLKDVLRQHSRLTQPHSIQVVELDPLKYAVSKSRYTGEPLRMPGVHSERIKKATKGTVTAVNWTNLMKVVSEKEKDEDEFMLERQKWENKEKEFRDEIKKLASLLRKTKRRQTIDVGSLVQLKKATEELPKEPKVDAVIGTDEVLLCPECISIENPTMFLWCLAISDLCKC
jgi:hypothetical protein